MERSLEHLVEVVEGREHLHLNFNPDRGSFVSWSAAAAAAATRQPFEATSSVKEIGGRGEGGGGAKGRERRGGGGGGGGGGGRGAGGQFSKERFREIEIQIS